MKFALTTIFVSIILSSALGGYWVGKNSANQQHDTEISSLNSRIGELLDRNKNLTSSNKVLLDANTQLADQVNMLNARPTTIVQQARPLNCTSSSILNTTYTNCY